MTSMRKGRLSSLKVLPSNISRWPYLMRFGAVLLLIHILVAISAGWWAPFGADELGGTPFSGASAEHWFGTDYLGRDVFSRVVRGARLELVLATAATVLGCGIGAAVGLACAYRGGVVDEFVMRVVDGLISIPFLMLALLVISAAGPERVGSPVLLVAVIGLIYAPRMARIARAAATEVVTRDFVLMAKLRGDSAAKIIRTDVLPNSRNSILIEVAVRLGNAPVVIGSLGFLGFGIQAPTPEWGLMISENLNALSTSPASVVGPAVVLATLVVGINLTTEGAARLLDGHHGRLRK